MRLFASAVVPLVSLFGFTDVVSAQVIGVQQPVVGVHAARTTVVVPDRGELFIGGVGRAATGHRHFGPFGAGTSVGLERSYSGMSVRVWVHDLRAMDRAVLNRARRQAVNVRPEPELPENAEHAYRSLLTRHRNAQSDVPGKHARTGPAGGAGARAARRNRKWPAANR